MDRLYYEGGLLVRKENIAICRGDKKTNIHSKLCIAYRVARLNLIDEKTKERFREKYIHR